MECRVRYSRWPDNLGTLVIRGHITVTAEEVQVLTRRPLIPLRLYPIIFFVFYLLITLFPFISFYCQLFITALPPLPYKIYLFSVLGLGVAVLICGAIPLCRRRLAIPRRAITGSRVRGRELLLQTAGQPIIITAKTTGDAQALAAAVRLGPAAPVTYPIRAGREPLADNSGFNFLRPVTLSLADGMLTLQGTPTPGARRALMACGVWLASMLIPLLIVCVIPQPAGAWERILAVILMLVLMAGGIAGAIVLLSYGKHIKRTLPVAELQDIDATHRYVTFLAPDAQTCERRYTLPLSSPDEAAVLVRRLHGADGEPFQTTWKREQGGQAEQQYDLNAPAPESFRHPGRIAVDDDAITFAGYSGVIHPWATPLTILVTLLIYLLLIPLLAQINYPAMEFDAHDRTLVTYLLPIVPALLFVYPLFATVAERLLAKRVTLPRTRLHHIRHVDNAVTLFFSTTTSRHRVDLLTDTDEEAAALAEQLSA